MVSTAMLTACGPKAKTFEGAGVQITLTNEFSVEETVLVPFYLISKNHIFMANRESKTVLKTHGVNTLQQYVDLVLSNAGKVAATQEAETSDKTPYIFAYYNSSVNGQNFGYMLMVFEGERYFYTMNFGCLAHHLETYKDQYIKWASTIKVE
jgi:hypothetical protein